MLLGTSEIFGNVSHFSGNTLVFFLSEFGFFSSRVSTDASCSSAIAYKSAMVAMNSPGQKEI